MRGKKLFLILFLVLILGGSGVIMASYQRADDMMMSETDDIPYYLQREIHRFVIGEIIEDNPDADLLTIEGMSEEENQIVENTFKDVFMNNRFLDNAGDFFYSLKDSQKREVTKKEPKEALTEEEVLSKREYHYFKDGSFSGEGDYSLENLLFNEVYSAVGKYDGTINYEIHLPDEYTFSFMIPEEFDYHSGYSVSRYYSSPWELAAPFSVTVMVVSGILMTLLILVYPIRYVKEIHPFKTMRKMKAEILIPFMALIWTGATVGLFVLVGETLTGQFSALFAMAGIVSYPEEIIFGMNYFAWCLWFLLVALTVFYLKYILADGFVRFLKEDTIVGSICRFVVRVANSIFDIDLSQNNNRKLLLFVGLNTLFVALLTLLWGFGTLAALLYGLILFFFLKGKMDVIGQEYNDLISTTREVAHGNFDVSFKEEGVFVKLEDELRNIQNGFEDAVKEEMKSQYMKTELITNVSHDLKTPLTGIKNYIELLQDPSLTEEKRQEYLEVLEGYSDRLKTLIEDLFEVSKANSGNIVLERMDLDIISLLQQVKTEQEEMLKEKGLDVIVSSNVEKVILHLDGNKTSRVFENLFTNIYRYALENTRVYIDVNEEEKGVTIAFKNISKEAMNFTSEEIVERFVRGDRSRSDGGSGLGLAIVKSFVEAQDGQFDIRIDGDLFKAVLYFPK